jgi:hypothetical protein
VLAASTLNFRFTCYGESHKQRHHPKVRITPGRDTAPGFLLRGSDFRPREPAIFSR